MQQPSLEDLLDKYLSGTLSEEERQMLNALLKDPEQQAKLAAMLDVELQEHVFEGIEDNNLLAQIQANIQTRISNERKPAKLLSISFRRIAVAAIFLLLAGGAVYWWLLPRKGTDAAIVQQTTPAPPKDIAPGGQRAILQLADGTEIKLDSAGDGMLAQQGKVKVIKQQDGRISYDRPEDKTAETLYNTITTPKGGQYQLLLADGSRVWLNAASSLRFPVCFTGAQRKVELKGEGYFEIAHIAARPFHVQVNNMDIQVLGTHFNVNAYTDEATARTTLLEGSVKVSEGATAVSLQPGQQAARTGNGQITVENNVNIEEVMAWKNGMFFFKGADLETILRQAARWYDVDIDYEGKIAQRFSGQISRNVNASQLFNILELTGKVHFEIEGKKVIVKP